MARKPKIKESYKIIVPSSYLPNCLVRVGLFESNVEARKYIREQGIVFNGNITTDCDIANNSTNFDVVYENNLYQFFHA